MKISADSLATMRAAIAPLDTEEVRAQYRAGDFPRVELVKDLDKRYRWDLAYGARVNFSALYDEGLHDTHIDTALRAIVDPLNGEEG